MEKSFALRNAAKKVAIVLVAALIATLLTPSFSDAATVTKTLSTDVETGAFSNSIDPQTRAYTANVTLANKILTFTSYTSGDWDFIDGTDYWSYRTTNGVTTVQYRVGTVTGSLTGKPAAENSSNKGVYEFYSGARLMEKHEISGESWKREAYDATTGAVSASIAKVVAVSNDWKTATVTTTIISDAVATPTTTPTATPSATPSATPTVTPPPFVAPTLAPSATPTTTPTITPSATPEVTPEVTPSTAPAGDNPVVAPKPISNFSDLKHSTKIEKKAYSSLKSLEKMAKKYGWGEKRKYTRKSSSSKKVKTTVYYKGDFGGDKYVTFSFTQVVKKSGKKYLISYYQKGKKVSTSGVKKVIQRKIK